MSYLSIILNNTHVFYHNVCLFYHIGRALKKRSDKLWPELFKKLHMEDFSDPWWALMAKRAFLLQMRLYLKTKRIREYLANEKGYSTYCLFIMDVLIFIIR